MEPLPRNRSLVVWRKYRINNRFSKTIRTICDILRELHRDAEDRGDQRTADLIETAHDMAKRMQDKLKLYAYQHGGDVSLIVTEIDKIIWTSKQRIRKAEKRSAKNKMRKGVK